MKALEQILVAIKAEILQLLPDAEAILFGSRASGIAHDESDWDILILTNQPVTPKLKQAIHNKVFPLSVVVGDFINLLLVSRSDWNQNASYYSLKKSIANNSFLI